MTKISKRPSFRVQTILIAACFVTVTVRETRAVDPADQPQVYSSSSQEESNDIKTTYSLPYGLQLGVTFDPTTSEWNGGLALISPYSSSSDPIDTYSSFTSHSSSASFTWSTSGLAPSAFIGGNGPSPSGFELIVEAVAGTGGSSTATLTGVTVTGQGVKPGGVMLPVATATAGAEDAQIATTGVTQLNMTTATVTGNLSVNGSGSRRGEIYFRGDGGPYHPRCPTCIGGDTPVGFSNQDIGAGNEPSATSGSGADLARGGSSTNSVSSAIGMPGVSTSVTYNNLTSDPGDVGVGWSLAKYPTISRSQAKDVVIFTAPGDNELHFNENKDNNGNVVSYTPFFGGCHDQVILGNNSLTLVDSQGTQATYGEAVPGGIGKINVYTDPNGVSTHFYYDSNQRVSNMIRTITASGHTTVDTLTYTPYASGVNTGLPHFMVWTRAIDGGTAAQIRKVTYSYYGGTYSGYDAYGNQGDLQSVTTSDANNVTIDQEYYRYYTPNDSVVQQNGTNVTVGFSHGLKYSFNPGSFKRLVAATGDPTQNNVNDAAIAPFATKHFQYNSSSAVTLAETQGSGCSCSGSGQGSYSYFRQTNSNPSYTDGYNNWKTVTTETLPDNNQKIVYLNYMGQVLLEVKRVYSNPLNHASSYTDFPHFTCYNDLDQVEFNAEASAFVGGTANTLAAVASIYWDDTHNDLVIFDNIGSSPYLNQNVGVFHTYGYDAVGHVVEESIQLGMGDLEDFTVSSMTYTSHTDANGSTLYFLASSSTYPTFDTAFPETTNYSYTWTTGTNQIQTRTTTKPLISADENGPGTADVTTEYFDTFGNVMWKQDPDRYVQYTACDPSTNAVVQTILHVDYVSLSSDQQTSFNSTAWSHPVSNAPVTTIYSVDNLGALSR